MQANPRRIGSWAVPLLAVLTTAALGVARTLGLETVGERVNDEPTLALIADLGVECAQGFHLGPPSPIE